MPLTLYDPRGISPTDYKSNYPELSSIAEYQDLSYAHLIFVWWYANPSSPLVQRNIPFETRVKVALDKAELIKKLTKAELNGYIQLKFPDNISEAINRSHKFQVGLRANARETLMAIFDNYQKINDLNNFREVDKEGNTGDVDYAKYMTVSAKVSEAMPKLIQQIEEGFGVVDSDGIIGADADMADDYLSVFMETKRT